MDVEVTQLPGLGRREDFLTHTGRRIGVVTLRDGTLELIVSPPDDPDVCSVSLTLDVEEAYTLANLLGAPHLIEYLESKHRDLAALHTTQLELGDDSLYVSSTLGDTQMRTQTGVSIVAVVRAGSVHPSPRPDFQFHRGDSIVVVGTHEGIARARALLAREQ